MEDQKDKKCSCSGSCEYDVAEGLENIPVFYNGKSCVKTWKKFKYVTRNIPGPGSKLEEFETKYEGCHCKDQFCSPDSCPCILRFGLAYSKEGTILRREAAKESVNQRPELSSPILECNPNCSCGQKCLNRLIQYGLKYKTEVFDAGSCKGFGLRSNQFLQKGAFLCEYAGEIISLQEAQRRTSLLQANNAMNYILVLREHSGDQTTEICVDPGHFGNLGRFINHSCDPNLWMTVVRFSNTIPRLCLFTRRDVSPEEELTFHYGGLPESLQKDDFSRDDGSKKKICHCRSTNCTGFLPFDESLFNDT